MSEFKKTVGYYYNKSAKRRKKKTATGLQKTRTLSDQNNYTTKVVLIKQVSHLDNIRQRLRKLSYQITNEMKVGVPFDYNLLLQCNLMVEKCRDNYFCMIIFDHR